MSAKCEKCGAPVNLAPDGDPRYSQPSSRVTDAAIYRELEAKKAADSAYAERNKLVAYLAHQFPSGVARTAIEGWDPEWHGCVYIDTPAGQLSWHYHEREAHLFADLPPYDGEWDGHTTDEKYERLGNLHLP